MKLTPEMTQGTRTFHLRDSVTGPGIDVTLVVRQKENGIDAGIAICSLRDQFSRRIGRQIAFTRLMSEARPLTPEGRQTRHFLVGATYQEIEEQVFEVLENLQDKGSEQFYSELEAVCDMLNEPVAGDDEIVPLAVVSL